MARGTRDLDDGTEPVEDQQLQEQLETRARTLQAYALSIGAVVTIVLYLLPFPFP